MFTQAKLMIYGGILLALVTLAGLVAWQSEKIKTLMCQQGVLVETNKDNVEVIDNQEKSGDVNEGTNTGIVGGETKINTGSSDVEKKLREEIDRLKAQGRSKAETEAAVSSARVSSLWDTYNLPAKDIKEEKK